MKLIKWVLSNKSSYFESLFLLETKYLDFIKDKIIIVNLGEIEGEYSEVDYVMDINDFKVVDCTESFLLEFENLFQSIGLNPFEFQGELKNAFIHSEDDDYLYLTIKEQIDKLNEKSI